MPLSLPGRLALFPLLLLALACDRRTEPFVDLAHEPPKVDRPVHVPGLENPAPRAQMPMGQRGTTGAPDASGAPIRGTVVAGEGVSASGDGILFVIARNGAGGPPLAVKRLPVGPFPLAFELGPADVMMAGRPFAGPINLTARVDRDGDPLTHAPDEPSAELAAPVEPGAEGVELRLEPPGAAAPLAPG
ncbi:MAG: c-type cytochrome biogenesis protein CcmI/CycH, partial [bacterium]